MIKEVSLCSGIGGFLLVSNGQNSQNQLCSVILMNGVEKF